MSRSSFPVAAATLFVLAASGVQAEETEHVLPVPAIDVAPASSDDTQTAVLAGGCYWGIQGLFEHIKGVKRVVAGYAGGEPLFGLPSPDGMTEEQAVNNGRAESVEVEFDPKLVTYGQLLRIYFSVIDPTTLNYQNPDQGAQYRSEIFPKTADQARVAKAYIAQLEKVHAFSAPIVTKVSNSGRFYSTVSQQQDYMIRYPNMSYIAHYDIPKLAKLKRFYPNLYMDKPVSVTGS
jgi:peptide-methionine (S)-S-oxide reductase